MLLLCQPTHTLLLSPSPLPSRYDKPAKRQALAAAVVAAAARRAPLHARYCESGFNAGYSAAVALLADPFATVLAFDIDEHGAVAVGQAFVEREFPGRLELTLGDSRTTVPAHAPWQHGGVCDVVFIDGGHELDVAESDLASFERLAAPGAALIVDDTGCDDVQGACDGPAIAWRRAVDSRRVAQERCDGEGFCVGRYVVVGSS